MNIDNKTTKTSLSLPKKTKMLLCNDKDDSEEVNVYMKKNHIYIRCDISMKSIEKFIKIITKYTNKISKLSRSEKYTLTPKPIYLHITTNGGELQAGFLAYDYIKNSKIPIYTISEGYCSSAGAVMFMGGSKRFMTENSFLMFHKLSQTTSAESTETFDDIVDNMKNIEMYMRKMYNIIMSNAREVKKKHTLTEKKLEQMLSHDMQWDYETCKKHGLVDDIYLINLE
jgi:ATP-dependent protease ClpP protease subunit